MGSRLISLPGRLKTLKLVQCQRPAADPWRACKLRVLTIIDGLIFTLFEVRFPFRFPSAVGENGKRDWELAGRMGAVCRYTDDREVRLG